jgi:5-methylcytosine-specific restriction endonuclease McrBC GTP-binding regulatory subunit McrB
MNTADRSIALMDAALRRRFRQLSFAPDYELLHGWLADHVDEATAVDAESRLKALNDALVDLLDQDRLIGHSYLMKDDLADVGFETVWEEELEPVIREHLFNRPDEVDHLRGVFLKR